MRPDALSRQFSSKEAPSNSNTILPTSCVLGALTWEIKSVVHEAQWEELNPGNGPLNCLFVPQSTRSQVLQWSHASRFSCHPGIGQHLSFLRRHFWWPSIEADTHSLGYQPPLFPDSASLTSDLGPQPPTTLQVRKSGYLPEISLQEQTLRNSPPGSLVRLKWTGSLILQ